MKELLIQNGCYRYGAARQRNSHHGCATERWPVVEKWNSSGVASLVLVGTMGQNNPNRFPFPDARRERGLLRGLNHSMYDQQ
ncbi:Hypothetical predicted protein [Prunus dulcis]|uniref:Uncharacterized protein n=1 Tax=Prunus dulcis TaxID=3755 RepID=A0A5E4G3I6_PRUDU|nr:Hypothetical predicted protein [Prunus dulcis]